MRRAWDIVGRETFESVTALRIPIDRLAGLPTRPSADDVTIDIAIAAETFFRAGDVERRPHNTGVLVANRAADFADGRDLSMVPDDVRTFFKEAKDIRNGLVHRGAFDSALLPASPNGERMAHSEFNEFYEMLVRRALQRALTLDSAPATPTWPPA